MAVRALRCTEASSARRSGHVRGLSPDTPEMDVSVSPRRRPLASGAVVVVKVLFWVSLAALVWTHAAYPALVALAARVRTRPVRTADATPTVTVIVAAHDEEA